MHHHQANYFPEPKIGTAPKPQPPLQDQGKQSSSVQKRIQEMEASKLDRDRSKSPQFAGQKLPESKPPERGNNNLLLSKPAEQKQTQKSPQPQPKSPQPQSKNIEIKAGPQQPEKKPEPKSTLNDRINLFEKKTETSKSPVSKNTKDIQVQVQIKNTQMKVESGKQVQPQGLQKPLTPDAFQNKADNPKSNQQIPQLKQDVGKPFKFETPASPGAQNNAGKKEYKMVKPAENPEKEKPKPQRFENPQRVKEEPIIPIPVKQRPSRTPQPDFKGPSQRPSIMTNDQSHEELKRPGQRPSMLANQQNQQKVSEQQKQRKVEQENKNVIVVPPVNRPSITPDPRIAQTKLASKFDPNFLQNLSLKVNSGVMMPKNEPKSSAGVVRNNNSEVVYEVDRKGIGQNLSSILQNNQMPRPQAQSAQVQMTQKQELEHETMNRTPIAHQKQKQQARKVNLDDF